MKITFINPNVNLDYSSPRAKIYPPLGLLSLATFLKAKFDNNIDINVVDEKVEEGISENIYKSDVMCIGVNSFNYLNGIKHAQKAKRYGAIVILGGPHATVFPENILRLRKEVDFIITHEGEVSLYMLISQLRQRLAEYDKIPNLFYRDDQVIKFSNIHYENDLKEVPIIDRSFISIDKYVAAFETTYREAIDKLEYRRPASVYSSKGCSWRDRSGGCIFCARLEKGLRFRNAEDIWEEIDILIREYNIDHIWDISDDNLNDTQWFRNFAYSKPKNINPKFLVYARASAINKEAISGFKELNVDEIYVGFESGDSSMLKYAGKGNSQVQNLKALEMISKSGINIYPSFVLGLPGETENSLKNTLNFVKQIIQSCNFYRISATILIPIPGSRAFTLLAQHKKLQKKDYLKQDSFDLKAMEEEWVELFTKVDYETLKKYRDEINSLNIEGVWT